MSQNVPPFPPATRPPLSPVQAAGPVKKIRKRPLGRIWLVQIAALAAMIGCVSIGLAKSDMIRLVQASMNNSDRAKGDSMDKFGADLSHMLIEQAIHQNMPTLVGWGVAGVVLFVILCVASYLIPTHWLCGSCRNVLPSKHSRLCPVCHAQLI